MRQVVGRNKLPRTISGGSGRSYARTPAHAAMVRRRRTMDMGAITIMGADIEPRARTVKIAAASHICHATADD